MAGRFRDFLERFRRAGADPDQNRLAAIVQLSRGLAMAEDRRQLLGVLLDEAVALFGAERGFLIRAPDAQGEIEVDLARSLDREPVRTPRAKISATIVRRALAERRGLFVADAAEGDFGAAQSVADQRLRSVLCMPLLVGESCLGCLYLDHRFQSGVFREQDLPWLQAFADQAAIALHLHRLLDDNRAMAARLAERNRELEVRLARQEHDLAALQPTATRAALRHPHPEILGSSPALVRCLELLERVADQDLPVLLTGESGTGKELFARDLHRIGPRRSRAFVAANLAALSPSVVESELFGHVRGAFTGADRDRVGLLREASGGVLFLDEVTEMPADLQAKLLRVLEERAVRPVGSDRAVPIDVRLVAATNRDPLQAVAEGRLRRDLYYRLAAVTIAMPPLRERRGDIPELVAHFLAEAAALRGGTARRVSPELAEELQRRTWPGNLRQLRHEILRLDAMATGETLGVESLPAEVPESVGQTLDLAALEQWAIQQALRRSGGNKAEAARLLGISRRALYNKLGEKGPEGA
ncbi:MAG: sigma-54-dependent Fis family transcriptional regulator [Planctomycetes bacterium]|nr:sigma-54-dependent Fis family transcriptional regulator [Planctomycetota bacterium]